MRALGATLGPIFAVAVAATSCTDLGSFTTEAGECYRGHVVAAEFVRTGFERETQLALTLDVSALADGRNIAGRLWSSDGRFNNAKVSQMKQLAHDSLSSFQFPGGRIRNYLAHATATDGAPATIVVSLMENGKVEVRIIRAEAKQDIESLFGVFRLAIEEQCPQPQ